MGKNNPKKREGAANRQYDWVIDLDISKFFDEIDHELLIKAVETVITEKWMKMQAIKQRMTDVKLRVNETKSKIAYFKDSWRKGEHEHNSYKFLGFQFQLRTFKSKSGKMLQSFKPAISLDNQTKIKEAIRNTIYWHSTSHRWNASLNCLIAN